MVITLQVDRFRIGQELSIAVRERACRKIVICFSKARVILIPFELPQNSSAHWQLRPAAAAAAFLAKGEVPKC